MNWDRKGRRYKLFAVFKSLLGFFTTSRQSTKIALFMASEVFLSRAKQCLRKKMRIEWNTVELEPWNIWKV